MNRSVGATAQALEETDSSSPEGAIMTSKRIEIEEFSIYDGVDRHPIHFRGNADGEIPGRRSEDYAAVMVRLDVDGGHNLVVVDLRRSETLRVLDRAIECLTEVRDRYAAMVPEDLRELGQCMTPGDWGRCELDDDHEVEHKFPTQVEWQAVRDHKFPKSA